MRLRLLAFAVGIVAVSLVLSGFLTGVLVRQLEFSNAQEQLDRSLIVYRSQIVNRECYSGSSRNNGLCDGVNRLDTPDDYVDRLRNQVVPGLGSDRLLLVTQSGAVVFDSSGSATVAPNPSQAHPRQLGQGLQVQELNMNLGGIDYIASAARLPVAGASGAPRDPLNAAWVVLARNRADVAAQAGWQLAPLLLLAGGVSLAVALLLALLVSRTLARPLTELAAASEDIAQGNYGRRVDLGGGSDEVGVVGAAFNRMAEAVERARQAQREFLANASHELKTPLTSLIGFSQALVDGSLETDAERRRAAVIVHEESQRVLRMSQELLDLARVETGHISLSTQPVDLAVMLRQELELIRPRAAERSLELDLVVPPRLQPAQADPERLHQVLDNLIDNAAKYTPAGGTIRVTAVPGGAEIEVVVSNPVGSHRPDPARMFDRFYRADPSRAASGGVGLGLAISRELAAVMGGRLWAEVDGAGWIGVHLVLPVAATGTPERAAAAVSGRPAVSEG